MEIIDYWSRCSLGGPSFVHPDDIQHRAQLTRHEFADDLIPVPYVGDIANAKIVIAMINPGLQIGKPSEYDFESRPEMQEALRHNLYQDFASTEFPFFTLNPALSFHPGYRYWHSRFKRGMADYAKQRSCSLMDAQRVFAKNIAILELVPYHSVSYAGKLHLTLSSSAQAKQAFKTLSSTRLLIVPRKHHAWGLTKPTAGSVDINGHIVSYYHQAACIGDTVRSLMVARLLNA